MRANFVKLRGSITRRLVRLDLDDIQFTAGLLDKLLAKKRSSDRKHWLEQKGNLADLGA